MTETRQPVECGTCGWTGRRMTGNTVTCPKCGSYATFVWTPPVHSRTDQNQIKYEAQP